MTATALVADLSRSFDGKTSLQLIRRIVVVTEAGCLADHIDLEVEAISGRKGTVALRNNAASWQAIETVAAILDVEVTHEHRDWDNGTLVAEHKWVDSPIRIDRIKRKEIAGLLPPGAVLDAVEKGNYLAEHTWTFLKGASGGLDPHTIGATSIEPLPIA